MERVISREKLVTRVYGRNGMFIQREKGENSALRKFLLDVIVVVVIVFVVIVFLGHLPVRKLQFEAGLIEEVAQREKMSEDQTGRGNAVMKKIIASFWICYHLLPHNRHYRFELVNK